MGTEFPSGTMTEFWRWVVGVEEVLQTEGAAGAEALRWEPQGARGGRRRGGYLQAP